MHDQLRILIAALGSYGDVHPFLAIARELQTRGHDVRTLMPPMYEGLATSLGLTFIPIGSAEQFDSFANRPELWHPVKGFQIVAEGVRLMLEPYYHAIEANHVPGRTVLVYSSLVLSARIAQETLHIPAATVHLSPAIIRSKIHPAKTPPLPVSSRTPIWWNEIAYRVIDWLIIDRLAVPLNQFRSRFGLAPVKRIFDSWLHSPDRVIGLFPDWFATPSPTNLKSQISNLKFPPDWPPQTVLTGFPLYDEADITPIDPTLEEFLNAGDPPIVFTPGSAMRHGREFFEESVKACQLLNRRGLLLSRHVEQIPPQLPPTSRHFEYAPFSRLLPRCAAIVHHGGIGTSAQALAAGIPHLVVPMAHDQFDNAARLNGLGVAEILPAGRYTAARAAERLQRAMDAAHRTQCATIKGLFATSNPFLKTMDLIEGLRLGG